MGKGVAKISEQALDLLARHAWPGNVRELENAIERAVALETSEAILPERLPEGIRGGLRPEGGAIPKYSPASAWTSIS